MCLFGFFRLGELLIAQYRRGEGGGGMGGVDGAIDSASMHPYYMLRVFLLGPRRLCLCWAHK